MDIANPYLSCFEWLDVVWTVVVGQASNTVSLHVNHLEPFAPEVLSPGSSAVDLVYP